MEKIINEQITYILKYDSWKKINILQVNVEAIIFIIHLDLLQGKCISRGEKKFEIA